MSTLDELKLKYELIKLAYFAREKQKDFEEMDHSWVTDLTVSGGYS